jgi:hypothetical protein
MTDEELEKVLRFGKIVPGSMRPLEGSSRLDRLAWSVASASLPEPAFETCGGCGSFELREHPVASPRSAPWCSKLRLWIAQEVYSGAEACSAREPFAPGAKA